MADGDLELAIQKVAAAMAGIRVENGYRHDVVKVYRTMGPLFDSLDSIETPALGVGRTPGVFDEPRNLDERGYVYRIPISVIGCIKRGAENAEDDLAPTRGEALLSDIRRVQFVDPKFGTQGVGPGNIKQSIWRGGLNDAAWDASAIYVLAMFDIWTVTDGVNP